MVNICLNFEHLRVQFNMFFTVSVAVVGGILKTIPTFKIIGEQWRKQFGTLSNVKASSVKQILKWGYKCFNFLNYKSLIIHFTIKRDKGINIY